jgi:Cof subfamily protein (haloacid dehalogenase superfamily)
MKQSGLRHNRVIRAVIASLISEKQEPAVPLQPKTLRVTKYSPTFALINSFGIMNIKALFFDIDGTLVSFRTHRIPQSTVDALRQAKAGGTRIFISTGRPVPFINNLGQISDLIDGYITTNGALCFVGSKRVSLHEMLRTDVEAILQKCRDVDCSCVVVGTEGIAIFNHEDVVDEQFRRGLGLNDFSFAPLSEVLGGPILQVSPFLTAPQEAELMPTLTACTSGRWSPAFTDITHVDADKGKGLLAMAAYLDLNIDETMAFGDGGNDISILRRAGIGVAMGNAGDDVKRIADYVTADVDSDGISRAISRLLQSDTDA